MNTLGIQPSFESVQSLPGREAELLAEAIELFPYPIQVYDPDGTSVMVNKAMLAEYHAISPDMVVGKYNVLKDPSVIATGQLNLLKRAFQGETVFSRDVRVPLKDISQRYDILDLDVEAIYQDVTVFPILDDAKRVRNVVAFLVNTRVYRGKDEIEKAKDYIVRHWLDRFDANETAKAACLSRAHLARLFRKHTGVTPHQYYINHKIGRLKEKLLDTNLSIAQVFASCNINYNGHFARLFRERVGVSPSVYRDSVTSRRNEGQSMKGQIEDAQRSFTESPQSLFEGQDLLATVFESFPYPIQIFSPDGTARLINEATLRMIGIRSREAHVGEYNVFEDPIVRELGLVNQVKQVLKGKTVFLTDFHASYQDMIRYFNVVDRDIQTISSDITCFPLLIADGSVGAFAAVFIFKKIYRGKEEIGRGKQYIETHWHEPFDANETAKAACLSKSHFTKLFKKHVGLTPHQYYVDFKIKKLKGKLLDNNLTVAQAFAACGMDYNSHSSRLFRKKVGVTPSAYRENAKVK